MRNPQQLSPLVTEQNITSIQDLGSKALICIHKDFRNLPLNRLHAMIWNHLSKTTRAAVWFLDDSTTFFSHNYIFLQIVALTQ